MADDPQSAHLPTSLRDLTEDDVLRISEAAGDPDWLRDRRLEAFKAFADQEWPTVRDEEWRFTNPKRLPLDRPVLAALGEAPPPADGIVASLEGRAPAQLRIVDGGAAASTPSTGAAGVVVTDLLSASRHHEAVVREHLGTVVGSEERFSSATLAAFTTGALVHIPAEAVVDEPLTVTVQVTPAADGAVLVHRILVVADELAQATVYVDQQGDADATVLNVIEVVLGRGAQVAVVTAQDWGARVSQVTTHRARVGRDARYRHLEATLGGRTVYVRPDVRLAEEGGDAEMLGVYFANDGQQIEHRSLIHHDASHTTSQYVHKGAVQGESRTTWFGNIRIEAHAKATRSDETNRNLILSPGGRADTIPFLEIETSDVLACGHHSSVGQIDQLQLFYLTSRGIARDEAARMLVYAFFAEVLERIDLPGVEETFMGEIEAEITAPAVTIVDPRRR